jgi:hypothetical protein
MNVVLNKFLSEFIYFFFDFYFIFFILFSICLSLYINKQIKSLNVNKLIIDLNLICLFFLFLFSLNL